MGPLEVADHVGLGLVLHILEQTREDLAAEGEEMPYHPAHDVIRWIVKEAGRPGKDQGMGFYEYPSDRDKVLWPALRERFSSDGRQLSQAEMIERLMFVQALETARCFEEGVVTSIADANIGSIFG